MKSVCRSDAERARSHRARNPRRAIRSTCEPLEYRLLLSTINWTNRVVSDNFALYGGSANVARAIVDRAIDDWERVIVNFNYSGGGNTFNLTVNAAAIGGRGSTGSIVANAQGKPTSATVTMDDNGGGGGWYFDPVIGTAIVPDDGEYTALLTPFTANSPTGTGNDFYRTILHEIGHAVGLQVGGAGVISGTTAINSFLTNTGIADPVSAGTIFSFNVFGGPVEATFTNNGGGHLYEGPAVGGLPIHPNDLMNPGRTVGTGVNRRQLISDTNATVLRDAYNYTIALPSTINTFLANLNTTTNVVTVNGLPGTVNDTITIDRTGTNQRFLVTGTSELIPAAEISSISVLGGAGNDQINIGGGDIDSNLAFIDLSVNGGTGTDTLFYNDSTDTGTDSYTLTSSTFDKNTAGVANHTYSGIEAIRIDMNPEANVIDINGAPVSGNITVNGGDGDDVFNVGNGDIDNALVFVDGVFNGGGGSDTLYWNDTSDGVGVDTYTMTATTFQKGNTGVITYTSFSNILIDASPNDDQITVTGFGGITTIRGNAGNDTLDLDGIFGLSSVLVDTGSGADILRINTDGLNITPVRISNSQTLSELAIGAGGALNVEPGGGKVLRVNDLLTLGGRILLNDNFFIRGAATSTPSLAFYQERLTNGYNGGDWLGAQPSIISTPADANSFSLGYARASEVFGGGGGVFAGQAVEANAVLIRFTRYGDANLDGIVNLADFNRLAANFGGANTTWAQGNFDYNTATNLADFNKLAANFGLSAAPGTLDLTHQTLPEVMSRFARTARDADTSTLERLTKGERPDNDLM